MFGVCALSDQLCWNFSTQFCAQDVDISMYLIISVRFVLLHRRQNINCPYNEQILRYHKARLTCNKIQNLPSTYKHTLILLITQMQARLVFQFETQLAQKNRQFKTPLNQAEQLFSLKFVWGETGPCCNLGSFVPFCVLIQGRGAGLGCLQGIPSWGRLFCLLRWESQ